MVELASLSLTIDSTPAVDAANRMQAMAEQARAVQDRTREMQSQYEKLGRQIQEQTSLQQRLQDTYRGGLTEVDRLIDRIGKMREGWSALNSAFGQGEYSQAMQRLGSFATQFQQSAAGLEVFSRTSRQFAMDSREMVTALDRIKTALTGVGAESDRIRAQISGFGVSLNGRGADSADQVLRELVGQVRSMGTRRDVMAATQALQMTLGPLGPDTMSYLATPSYMTDSQKRRAQDMQSYAREIAFSESALYDRSLYREQLAGRAGVLRDRYSYGAAGALDRLRFWESDVDEIRRLEGTSRTPYGETIPGMLAAQAQRWPNYIMSGRVFSRMDEAIANFEDRRDFGFGRGEAPDRRAYSATGAVFGGLLGAIGGPGGAMAGAAAGGMIGGLFTNQIANRLMLGGELWNAIFNSQAPNRPGASNILSVAPEITQGLINQQTALMSQWNAEGADSGFFWAPPHQARNREAMVAGMIANRRTPFERQRQQNLLMLMSQATDRGGLGLGRDVVGPMLSFTADQILRNETLPDNVRDTLLTYDQAFRNNARAIAGGQAEDQIGYLSGAASAMRGAQTTTGRLGAMMRFQFDEAHRLMQGPTAQEQFRMLLAQGGLEHEMFVTQSAANRGRSASVFDAARSGNNDRIRLLQAELELSRDIAAATEQAKDGDESGLRAIRERVQERVRESRLNDEEQARQTRATIQAGNQAGAAFLDRRADMGVGARWMEDARAAAAGAIIERSGDKAYTLLSPQEQRNYALNRLRDDENLRGLVDGQIANQQRAGFLERQPGLQMDILGTSVGRTGFAAIDRQQRLQYEIMRLGLQPGIGEAERGMMEDLIRARFAGEGEGAFNGTIAQLMLSAQTARGNLGFLLTGQLPALAPRGPTTASGLTGNAAMISGAEWSPRGRNVNPSSGATGPLQITKDHWNRFADRLGLGRWESLSEAQRSDPAAQQRIYDAWAAEVGPRFGRLLGHQPSVAEMYPGWLLGDAGYERFLMARRDGAGGESALTTYAAALRRRDETMEHAIGRARSAFAANSPILRPDQTVDQALASINAYFVPRAGRAAGAAVGGGAVPTANIPSISELQSMSDDDIRRRLYGNSGLEARNFALNFGTQQGETDPARLSAVERSRMVSAAEEQLQSLATSAAQARVQISDLGRESAAAARGPYAVGRAQLDRELSQRAIGVEERAGQLRAIGQGGLADRLREADAYDAGQRRTIYDRNAQRRLDDEMRATGRVLDDQRWTRDNLFMTRSERAVEMSVRQEQQRLSDQYGLTSGEKYDQRIAQIRESARLGEFAREVDQLRDAFVGLGQGASQALEAAITRGASFRQIMSQVFATFGSRMLQNVSGKVMDYAISWIGKGIMGAIGGGAGVSAVDGGGAKPPPLSIGGAPKVRGGFVSQSFASGGEAEDLAIFPLGSTDGGTRGVKVLDGDDVSQGGMINRPTTLQFGGKKAIAGEAGSEAALLLQRTASGEPAVVARMGGEKVLLPVGRNRAGELGVYAGQSAQGTKALEMARGQDGKAELRLPQMQGGIIASYARGGMSDPALSPSDPRQRASKPIINGGPDRISQAMSAPSINQSININLNGGISSGGGGGNQGGDGQSHEELVAMLSRETARAARQATDEALLDHMRTGGYLNQLYNESAR